MAGSALEVRQIETTLLRNGIRVVTEQMPHVRSVSVGLWIGSGSRSEVGRENGISHFLEHMLFKGSETRSAEEIARSVDSIGGHLDAFTTKELVSYNTKVLDEHLPLAFDVLGDLVLNPAMREDDVEKEKRVILEELKMEADNPESIVHETFVGRFWHAQPLGAPIIGTKKTINGFNRDTLNAYHRRYYIPSNLLITGAGNVEHDRLVRLAERHFAHLDDTGPLAPEPEPQTFAHITLKKKRLQQVHLCLGVPTYPVAHEKRYACYLLNTVLGGGMSSRLFQNIRERQGLVYAVFSELNLFKDTGCLAIYAGTSNESVRKVIASVLHEFRELKENRLPAEELRRAKDHLKGSLMLSLESTSSRMANLARQQLYFPRFVGLDEMIDRIERVEAEEIQEIAQQSFQTDKIALTVLGRLDGVEIARENLVC